MIEVTDAMVQLVYERIDFVNHGDDGIADGLAAVLAIVERDYRVTQLCKEVLVPGLRCRRVPDHRGDHEGVSKTGNTVKWSGGAA